MYLLWRALRFWTITGALLYTFTSLTPHIFSAGDWLGRHFQTTGEKEAHTAALAMLHRLSPTTYKAPPTAELLGAADQPASIQEYYKDVH